MFNWKDKIRFKGDKVLWYVIIGLMIASVMVVYSSTGRLAYRVKDGNTSFYLMKQLFLMAGCFVVILGLQSVHYKYLFKFSKVILGMAFVFLLWAKFAGTNLNDADRWITIPLIGFTFQPSELAKIGIILYTARIITYYQTERNCSDEALKSVLLYVGPVIFMIFMDNFSTSLLMGLICMTMLFVGRLRLKLMAMSVGALIGVVGMILVLAFTVPQFEKVGRVATIKGRVTEFFAGGQREGYSYQSDQAKIAVAKGGFLGVGPGNSEQRNFLPHPYSDFIFAIIIEEYGLIGGDVVALSDGVVPGGGNCEAVYTYFSRFVGHGFGIEYCFPGFCEYGGLCGCFSGDGTTVAAGQYGRDIVVVYQCGFGYDIECQSYVYGG